MTSKKQKLTALKKDALPMGIVLGLGLVYYFVVRFTGWSFSCLFRRLTGLKCPGCGATHFVMAAAKGQFSAALRANVLLGILLLMWTGYLVFSFFEPQWFKVKKWQQVLLIVTIVLSAIFFIVRNFICTGL